jgi:hypothetical protein
MLDLKDRALALHVGGAIAVECSDCALLSLLDLIIRGIREESVRGA